MANQREFYKDSYGYKYSQIGEGGMNAANNCVPASFSDVLHAYGYLHTQPQWWVNNEIGYGPFYKGGTSYAAAIDWMRKNPEDFPNPPDVRISNPVDTHMAITGAMDAGYAVIVQGYSDGNGQFQDHPTGILHVSPVVGIDNDSIAILNVDNGVEQIFNRQFFTRATGGNQAGWLAVFARPLGHPTLPTQAPQTPQAAPDPLVVMTANRDDLQHQLDALNARITAAQEKLHVFTI